MESAGALTGPLGGLSVGSRPAVVVIDDEVDVDVADVELPLAMAARAMEPMRADCERILTEEDQRVRAGWENRMGVVEVKEPRQEGQRAMADCDAERGGFARANEMNECT